jgi:hypothetical protein
MYFSHYYKYMHVKYPSNSHNPLMKLCYNGGAHDNRCMNPSAKVGKTMSYIDWLRGDSGGGSGGGSTEGTTATTHMCEPMKMEGLKIEVEGKKFIESVPQGNRRPYRWGWKHPNSMYVFQINLCFLA